MSALEVKRTKVYGDLDFWSATWLNNFPFQSFLPSHPVVVPLRVARAGRRGLSFPAKADMPDMVSGTKPARPTWCRVFASRAKSML